MIRKAVYEDLDPVACIYEEVHQAEADGSVTTGWIRDIYPVKATAKAALERNDLFVLEEEGQVVGAGIINQLQVESYYGAPWKYDAADREVCVLHTLVISPGAARKGLGRKFAAFFGHCSHNIQRHTQCQSGTAGKTDQAGQLIPEKGLPSFLLRDAEKSG